MGKIKYITNIREFFKKSSVVDINSLKRIIPTKNKDYIYLLINSLMKRGEIKQITKGYYSLTENSSFLVFAFQPAYLGLQDALSLYNIWDQETIPVIVTTRNVRNGIRQVFGVNVLVRRINKKYFFGIEYHQEENYALPYSDVEKTFIDMIHFHQPLDAEIIANFKKKINRKKLKEYLKVYPEKIKKKAALYLSK